MRPGALLATLARGLGWVLVVGGLQASPAAAFDLRDPLGVSAPLGSRLPEGLGTAAGAVGSCDFGPLTHPLDLVNAVERALCSDPQTKSAWLNARASANQLGLAYSAFLPTVSASSTGTRLSSHTTEAGAVSNDGEKAITHQVKLDYLLFDFGARNANAKKYEQLLLAAGYARDDAVQQVFLSACTAYYRAQAAADLLVAAETAKKAARTSLHAIQARYVSGVATQADRLQASIAFSEAELTAVRAEADLRVAIGALASAIGLRPDADVSVPNSVDFLPADESSGEVEALFQEMQKNNPEILSAQAQVAAARYEAASVEASGAPSLALHVARSANHLHPFAAGTGNSSNQSYSVGVTLNIPLFDGFSRSYQISQARLGSDIAAANAAAMKQAMALNIWTSYQSLAKNSTSLRLSAELQANARESFRVAQGRYVAGVGDVLQLLNAQASMASADIDRIQTSTNWKVAKLSLLYYLGRLGFSELAKTPH